MKGKSYGPRRSRPTVARCHETRLLRNAPASSKSTCRSSRHRVIFRGRRKIPVASRINKSPTRRRWQSPYNVNRHIWDR